MKYFWYSEHTHGARCRCEGHKEARAAADTQQGCFNGWMEGWMTACLPHDIYFLLLLPS